MTDQMRVSYVAIQAASCLGTSQEAESYGRLVKTNLDGKMADDVQILRSPSYQSTWPRSSILDPHFLGYVRFEPRPVIQCVRDPQSANGDSNKSKITSKGCRQLSPGLAGTEKMSLEPAQSWIQSE